MFKKLNQSAALTALIIVGLYSPLVSAQSIIREANSTGTIVNQQGDIYQIEGGTQAGSNLFHSFTQLGLQQNEIVNFLSQPHINNILGRVTGGNISVIEGLIQVSGSNANLFLMNPAGIIFGSNARLDVPGSFTATTANAIGFEGGWFQSLGENEYQSLIGSPTSFAFGNGQTGGIVNQGDLTAANLSLIGGTVINTGNLNAPGGNITITAVPGGKMVRLSQQGMILGLEVPEDAIANGITPLDLPKLLTTPVEGITEIAKGDTVVSGSVVADTVNLGAVNPIKLESNSQIITGNSKFSAPTVTIFPASETDPLAYIFLDATVPDYQSFLYNGKPGSTTVVVTPEERGISVVSDKLATSQQVDEIHIVSEGNQGNFWLGRDFVSSENVGQYETQLQGWQDALSVGADILIYACLAALGEAGDSLLNQVADYTGADVAGSTNITGATSLEGDWQLEKSLGPIEADLAWQQEIVESYNHKLQLFTVTNANDAGGGSLREAINSTAALAGADEIRFSNSFTINLASGELAIAAQELTIDGGVNSIVVDGGKQLRIFNISNGAEVTLNNLTIQNGNAADSGGGIRNQDSSLRITNSNITNNFSADDGGGIFSVGQNGNIATLEVVNSTISSNRADGSGGGISSLALNGGTAIATVSNAGIFRNTSLEIGLGGGGVAAEAIGGGSTSTFNLTNTTISGNSSVDNGGGVSNRGTESGQSTMAISNSTISNNQGTGSSFDGGGGVANESFLNGNAVLTITNSEISNNTSDSQGGGGVINWGNLTGSTTVDITNTTISGNSTNNRGGGIFSLVQGDATSSLNISDTNINNNISTSNGGGGISSLVLDGGTTVVTVSNAGIFNNTSFGPGAGGGGITAQGNGINTTSTFTLISSTISGNSTADNGGGVSNVAGQYGNSTMEITSSTISNNQATGSNFNGGGGVANESNLNGNAVLNITDSDISNNASNSQGGGGVINWGNLTGSVTTTIVNSNISGNSTAGLQGGGIFNDVQGDAAGSIDIFNTTVTNNTAANGASGGGITNSSNGNMTINNSTITGNRATAGDGGGVNSGGNLTINNSTISNNT
ncbi:MAG: DUF4347 domain-containing protein, partial [Spirulinaceae cyanobacterium]